MSVFFSGEPPAAEKGRRFTAAMAVWKAEMGNLEGLCFFLLKMKYFLGCLMFLRSISMRNRTVVAQHCFLGNELKPLDEQELMSSNKKSLRSKALGKALCLINLESMFMREKEVCMM